MSFSSITFIWIFLPLVIGGYFIVSYIPHKYNNIQLFFLTIVSILFYLWGDVDSLPFLIFIIFFTWLGAILLDNTRSKNVRRVIIWLLIIFQILGLIYFKYWNFISDNIEWLTGIYLQNSSGFVPLGISFIIFQSISYLVDVYRKEVKAQKNIISIALYISFFPQLISGPIVRYGKIEKQLLERSIKADSIVYGIRRFIIGLGKKVIIADCLGQAVDTILAFEANQWGTVFAWFVWIGYSLQIYFDFSGYTDMAVGISRAFGFYIPENFNLPYTAKSIKEFWRRWHITLSNWFRDYIYIPLGGNRRGRIRTYRNLLIVFILTGLWHGASWNFLFWGLWHGFFMLLERVGLGKKLEECKMIGTAHIYTIAIVFTGWIFFRISSLKQAFLLLKLLFIPTMPDLKLTTYYFLNPYVITILIIGILMCGPIPCLYRNIIKKVEPSVRKYLEFIVFMAIFIYSLTQVVASTYSAFIYQQF